MNPETVCTRLPLAFALCALSAGCFVEEEPEPVSQAEVAARSGEIAAAVAAPAGAAASFGHALAAPTMGGDSGDDDRMNVEEATATGLFVDPACVSLSWSGLWARLSMDGCILQSTGQSADGAVSVGIEFAPLRLAIAFEELSLADHSLDGDVGLRIDGGVKLDIDLMYGGSDASVVLDEIALEADPAGLRLDGAGEVDTPSVNAAVVVRGLGWDAGQCLPTRGDIDFDDGRINGTITFLTTTPLDGRVGYRSGPFTGTVAAFSPC